SPVKGSNSNSACFITVFWLIEERMGACCTHALFLMARPPLSLGAVYARAYDRPARVSLPFLG
ncbi:hypothetical protein, partial [Pontibacter silvestris]|uniref:hypothetical protein n=1 Tax=Pontibacter silvestris TaxID=2305183 RepID=UPI001E54C4D2